MKLNFFKNFLLPPKYLMMPSFGIKIDNSCVRYLEFKNIKNEIRLSNFGEVKLPENTYKNGEVINKESLIQAISLIKDKVACDFAKVIIPEEKSYIFNIEIPKVKRSEIRQTLEFKLEENVPLKVDEAIFEYEVVKGEDDRQNSILLSVSVVPKKVVEEYLEIFQSAGIKVISFEIESKMVAEALISKRESGAVMIVNVKDDSTTLSIAEEGLVSYTSSVPVGNNLMLESLKRHSLFEKTDMEKIPEKIFSQEFQQKNGVLESLPNIFSIIKDDIGKFSDYWTSKSKKEEGEKHRKIKKIIFCGRSSAIPGFIDHVSQDITIDTEIANVWVNIFDINKNLPELKFIDSLDYPAVIGLAK